MNHIHYRDGYRYQLVEGYIHQLGFDTGTTIQHDFFWISGIHLMVYQKYAWDGPSGPTVDTPSFMRGALVHDVIYQAMREGLLSHDFRPLADDELVRICKEDGMNAFRRWYVGRLIRRFGDEAIEGGPKPILTAPEE